ncbi:hypothetical protein PAHAL_6G236000 [Panicum hallii]|uniref:Uncharacterized protein n=1 Tax=Panicum hallii TaxID=206008 RepID=A0A2T8IHB0_9POAL|nr:hypothetical protein PAHAL_6G236000 [Panicum hallii]
MASNFPGTALLGREAVVDGHGHHAGRGHERAEEPEVRRGRRASGPRRRRRGSKREGAASQSYRGRRWECIAARRGRWRRRWRRPWR